MAVPKRKLVAKPDDEELLINTQRIMYLPRVNDKLPCTWRCVYQRDFEQSRKKIANEDIRGVGGQAVKLERLGVGEMSRRSCIFRRAGSDCLAFELPIHSLLTYYSSSIVLPCDESRGGCWNGSRG